MLWESDSSSPSTLLGMGEEQWGFVPVPPLLLPIDSGFAAYPALFTTNITLEFPFMEPIDVIHTITSIWHVVRTICFVVEAE